MTGKTYSLAAILIAASGRVLDQAEYAAAVQLMSDIVGRPLLTHEVPRVQPACAAWILAGLRQLAPTVVAARDVPAARLPQWLNAQREAWGDAFSILPVPFALNLLLRECL